MKSYIQTAKSPNSGRATKTLKTDINTTASNGIVLTIPTPVSEGLNDSNMSSLHETHSANDESISIVVQTDTEIHPAEIDSANPSEIDQNNGKSRVRRFSKQIQSSIESLVSHKPKPSSGTQLKSYKTSRSSIGSPKFGRKRDRSHSVISQISSVESHSVASLSPAVPRFKLLSMNFFLRPPLIAESANGDWKEERLQLFLDTELSKYDVIAFQETFAFGSSRRDRLIKSAYVKGFKYSTACKTFGLLKFRIDGGLVILSRFPISKTAEITFDRGTQIGDWFAAKGVIYAQIRLPIQRDPSKLPDNFTSDIKPIHKEEISIAVNNGPSPNSKSELSIPEPISLPEALNKNLSLSNNSFPAKSSFSDATAISDIETQSVRFHLFTTHLQSGEGPKIMDIRRQQSRETKEFIDKVLYEENRLITEPVVFCGDFNVNSRLTDDNGVEHSEEWTNIVNILRGVPELDVGKPYDLGDIGYEAYGEHIITTNKLQVGENHPEPDKKSIDYFFSFREVDKNLDAPYPKLEEYCFEDYRIEPMYVEGKPFHTLSDHYAVAVDLLLKKEKREKVIRRVPGKPK